jgi:hypothetical protein
MKKWWVKLLVALAAVVLVIAVLVVISSAHSKNSVERYKDQLRAAGEKLDLKDLLPPHVNPDWNARDLMTQAFNSMAPIKDGMLTTNTPYAMKMVAPGKAMVCWQKPEIADDTGNAHTNTWEDLDHELQLGSAAIDFLRQASERPQLDFELDFDKGATLPLPHLSKMRESALLLESATLADLHRGNPASAATNIQTMLLTLKAWQSEPLPISQLVRMSFAQIGVTMQWEFLQGTNITEPQLAMLQRDWTNMDFAQPMERALEFDRGWRARIIEQLRTSNSPSSMYAGMPGGWSSGGGGSGDWLDTLKDMGQSMKRRASDSFWRTSWSYDDELRSLRGDQVLVETMREMRTNGFFKIALADRDRKISALGLDRPGTNWIRNQMRDQLEIMFGESVQGFRNTIDRVMYSEAARTITVTAIALKRYQLRQGTYPPDLKALVPEFLPEVPCDPVDGHPLRYQKLADGTFLLYSVGSDMVDNGGDPGPQPGTKTFQWQRTRDWVWPQPATPQEIEHFRNNGSP